VPAGGSATVTDRVDAGVSLRSRCRSGGSFESATERD
jgi:hypothetical protein